MTSTDIEQNFPNLSFCLLDIFFSEVHAKVNYRQAYTTINELSKKAIQIGLDAGSNTLEELENCMNSFISKYKPKGKEKMTHKRNISQQENEDKLSNSSSSDKENFIKIENPIVNSKRGAPRKKCFKSSSELENKSNSNTKHLEAQKI
ncbi:25462_t:CDS:1 [Dentiscutata erythropus]|uniref:25462_t:CDS:1 n=1 Tax=Dentiscutata erythropus TaxID=1348616 RepID=A0A9N9I866_9GLOM|nr:25462_t:CDS:1 [Dentiscutata erythropus]